MINFHFQEYYHPIFFSLLMRTCFVLGTLYHLIVKTHYLSSLFNPYVLLNGVSVLFQNNVDSYIVFAMVIQLLTIISLCGLVLIFPVVIVILLKWCVSFHSYKWRSLALLFYIIYLINIVFSLVEGFGVVENSRPTMLFSQH